MNYGSPLRKDFLTKPIKLLQKQEHKKQPVLTSKSHLVSENKVYEDGRNIQLKPEIGEGIFITNSFALLYNKQKNGLEGKQYLISKENIRIQANFNRGLLHGWMVSLYPNKLLICDRYLKGEREGDYLFFDFESNLHGKSVYRKGKLISMKEGIIFQQKESYLTEELIETVKKLEQNILFLNEKICSLKEKSFTYYGQNEQNMPKGFGILFSQFDIYCGQFQQGLLNGLGNAYFGNSHSYYGQFENGECSGYACLTKNSKVSYICNQKVIKRDEFEKYLQQRIDSSLEIKQKWLNKDCKMVDIYWFILKIYSLDQPLPRQREESRRKSKSQHSSHKNSAQIIRLESQFGQSQNNSLEIVNSLKTKRTKRKELFYTQMPQRKPHQNSQLLSNREEGNEELYEWEEVKADGDYIQKEGNLLLTKNLTPKPSFKQRTFLKEKGKGKFNIEGLAQLGSSSESEREDELIKRVKN